MIGASPAVRFPEGCLLIFARAPVAGQVKTRLMPGLEAESCARLQRWLVERTLTTATQAALCTVELWCAPDCSHPFFGECARRFAVDMRAQEHLDLGMRMHHGLRTILAQAEFAVIIGCDCPALDAAYLAQACEILATGDSIVLGPAEDGGYVLLGARRTSPELFEGVAWGTSTVLPETRERLRRLGWRWRELTPLWDLDRPADLARLAAEDLGAPIPPTTPASRPVSADSRVPP
jgi:rSAM/selenodomain-associated transferase 1